MKNLLPAPFGIRTICETTKALCNNHLTTKMLINMPSGVKVVLAVAVPNTPTKAERLACAIDLMKLGFNQKEAADFVGMSAPYLCKLLKGL